MMIWLFLGLLVFIIIINGYPEAGRMPLFPSEVDNFNTNINKNWTNTVLHWLPVLDDGFIIIIQTKTTRDLI